MDGYPILNLGARSAWRPVPLTVHRMAVPARKMGQSAGIAALGAIPLLVGGAIGAGVAWVGFSAGSHSRGLLAVLGYGLGIVGALTALGGVASAALWIAGVSVVDSAVQKAPQLPPPALPAYPPLSMTPQPPSGAPVAGVAA